MRPYPQPGESVGPYRLERRLGGSDHSAVYAATQIRSQQQVALKVISSDLTTSTTERRRIALAARRSLSLGSPHVARVHLYGEYDARVFIATDLVGDGPLSRVLDRQGGAPIVEGVDLICQVASGLAAIHGRGLVHGALTPSNVLIHRGESGHHALLVDGGTSRHDTAPEVHLGHPRTMASDIHSLGALTFWTLTGRPPFGGTDFQVAEQFVKDNIPQLAGTSPRVVHLNATLARAMHHNPAARHQSAAEFRSDLMAAMGKPGEPGPLDVIPPPPLTPTRNTMLWTVWILIGVMMTGLIAASILLANA